jgi:hypothetical protein
MLFGTNLGRRAHQGPLPSTGEGKGGGECQRRLSIELSPIPPFPARGESV